MTGVADIAGMIGLSHRAIDNMAQNTAIAARAEGDVLGSLPLPG